MFSKYTKLGAFCGFALLVGLLAVADKPQGPVQDQIRKALEGEAGRPNSGDGMLDDVLNVIKQRGSILDGSVLDERPIDVGSQANTVSTRAIAAEQLLKASRLLERLGQPEAKRKTLIKQIRAEAAILLSE